ncbi:hypothetical protein [Hymenobacter terrenus]|uniref:hypothetical protein n=1 Tax=Hymenobacter terrenus TaxID=1629124 RepID=UPI000619224B|nr:hypothetical protein [Hymenobacter terrenus]
MAGEGLGQVLLALGNYPKFDTYNRWSWPVLQTTHYRNAWGADALAGVYYILLRRPATGYLYKG